MPRAYTLADVFSSLNEDVSQALGGAEALEVLSQLIGPYDSLTLTESYTIPAPAANNSNWGTAKWGQFQWS